MTHTSTRPATRRPRYRLRFTPAGTSISDATRRPGGPQRPPETLLAPSWDRDLFYAED
jgi:hypothetical protein